MKRFALLVVAVALVLTTPAFAQLTAGNVRRIIKNAVTRAVKISPNSVIAVTIAPPCSSTWGAREITSTRFKLPKARQMKKGSAP